jgi:hypothetical protein
VDRRGGRGLLKELSSDIADEASKLADKEIEKILKSADARKITLEAFKEALAELPAALVGGPPEDKAKPLVFIIDELDRCTPPFALNLLERVKHIFTVQNVHFVLGIHEGQLCESIKAIYGRDIEARKYLQKFIHITVPLVDTSQPGRDSVTLKYIGYLVANLKLPPGHQRTLELIGEFLSEYDRHQPLTLRDLERLYATMALGFSVVSPHDIAVGPLIVGLAVLKLRRPELYLRAKKGQLTINEAMSALSLGASAVDDYSKRRIQWNLDWFRYALDPEAPQEMVDKLGSGTMLSLRFPRLRIVPHIANDILDKFIPSRRG